jgi:hypothetical protein
MQLERFIPRFSAFVCTAGAKKIPQDTAVFLIHLLTCPVSQVRSGKAKFNDHAS